MPSSYRPHPQLQDHPRQHHPCLQNFLSSYISAVPLNSFKSRNRVMLMKKKERFKKLAKKVKVLEGGQQSQPYKCLTSDKGPPSSSTPTGFFAVYVGEDHHRFVVPMDFLSHPLFKMLLEKAYNEYGFDQRIGLVVPCTVSLFQEVLSAVERSHGQFDIEKLVDEFI